MTSAQHMLWMLDEYENHPRRQDPGFHHRQAVAMAALLAAPRPPVTV
jgi:hypothetical protein